MKAEDTDVAEGTLHASRDLLGSYRLGSVLDNGNAMYIRNLPNRIHVRHAAVKINRYHGLGARRNASLEGCAADAAIHINVCEGSGWRPHR